MTKKLISLMVLMLMNNFCYSQKTLIPSDTSICILVNDALLLNKVIASERFFHKQYLIHTRMISIDDSVITRYKMIANNYEDQIKLYEENISRLKQLYVVTEGQLQDESARKKKWKKATMIAIPISLSIGFVCGLLLAL